jgi:hypothetical protein
MLGNITVPEHKLGVFECAVSDFKGQVSWFFNNQNVENIQSKKRFQILSIGEFRRLAIRDCLISESDSTITCKWENLETTAKLFVTGNEN